MLEINCKYPGKPDHGHTHGTFPAKVNSVVTFACEPGYVLKGNNLITCKNNGQWTGSNPTLPKCQRK